MNLSLPPEIAAALAPVFEALPIARAMQALVVHEGTTPELRALVETALRDPALAKRPALAAGLWLYVDELDRSHTISQSLPDATGSFWHGIMHRREGDFANSHYWINRAGAHPAMAVIPGYDAHRFIDEVAGSHRQNAAGLIDTQRAEWAALFAWCARQPAQV